MKACIPLDLAYSAFSELLNLVSYSLKFLYPLSAHVSAIPSTSSGEFVVWERCSFILLCSELADL